jgi:ankyrin repeat protein
MEDATRESFLRCFIVAAQNGYARDVEPFLGLCREIWWEVQIFDALKDLPHGTLRRYPKGKVKLVPYGLMRTRVMFNAFIGNAKRLSWLIERGAKLELRDSLGRTALMWAAQSGSAECVSALAARGADVEARCLEGRTPLQVAVRVRAWGAVGALLAVGADATNAIFTATQKKEWLLDVSRAGSVSGCFALLHAMGPGDARGGALGAALCAACEGGHAPLAEALLSAGAHLEAEDEYGERPLSMAVKMGHVELAKALLELGASVRCADFHDGNTVLHWAVERGVVEVVPLLLAHGADAGVRNAFGKTPAALARGPSSPMLHRLLKGAGVQLDVEEVEYGTAAPELVLGP